MNPVKDGLNLVAKEGPLRQPPRRRGAPLAGGGCVRRARRRGAGHPPVRHRTGRARPAHRARHARRRTRPRARRRLCELAEVHTPQSWLRELLNQARAERVARATPASAARPAGPSTTTSARCTSGGLSGDVTPMLTPWRSAPSRSSVCSAAKAGRSPASSPANAATDAPRARSATVVPLSTGTGGRSSTAIRPRSGASSRRRARGLVGPRDRLGPAVGLGAPVDGDGHTPLALHQQPGQRLVGLVGGTRDRARPMAGRGRRPPPRRRRSVRGRRRRRSPARRCRARPAGTRPVARSPRPPVRNTGTSRASVARAAGRHRGRAGVADDRRERTVEVGEERARGGIVDERSQRGREGHDASASGGYAVPMITMQSASDAPVGRVGGVRLHLRAVRRRRRARARRPHGRTP